MSVRHCREAAQKDGAATGVGLLACIFIGLAVGALGSRTMPKVGVGSLMVSALVGASGASVGALAVGLITDTWLWGFSVWSLPAAIAGAMTLLLVYGRMARVTP